jgi:hypothetical protein
LEETKKLSPAERLEKKVQAALVKRDQLLESLDKEILSLTSRLTKAKELREKLKPGEVGVSKSYAPASQLQAPGPPLKGFRSNGRLPPDPIDAMIREGKIG